MMKKKTLLILLILIALLNGNSFLLRAEDPKTLEIGASAPSFSLPGVDGKIYTLDNFSNEEGER